MNKLIWIAIGLIIGLGVLYLVLDEGIDEEGIPAICADVKDDACTLYECMVDRCWCVPLEPIVSESFGIVTNTDDAMAAVQTYLDTNPVFEMEDDVMPNIIVERAVELDNYKLFYNVFADKDGDEKVYAVHKDGTVFITQCGV